MRCGYIRANHSGWVDSRLHPWDATGFAGLTTNSGQQHTTTPDSDAVYTKDIHFSLEPTLKDIKGYSICICLSIYAKDHQITLAKFDPEKKVLALRCSSIRWWLLREATIRLPLECGQWCLQDCKGLDGAKLWFARPPNPKGEEKARIEGLRKMFEQMQRVQLLGMTRD